MALALHSEGREMTVFFIDRHLPIPGGQVHGCENSRVGLANATDALIHFFHEIFARVHLGIESTDILNNSEPSTTFLGNTEDGGVEGRFGLLNYSKTKPFLQRFFFKKGAQVGGRTWDLFDFHLFSLTSSALDHSATAPPLEIVRHSVGAWV